MHHWASKPPMHSGGICSTLEVTYHHAMRRHLAHHSAHTAIVGGGIISICIGPIPLIASGVHISCTWSATVYAIVRHVCIIGPSNRSFGGICSNIGDIPLMHEAAFAHHVSVHTCHRWWWHHHMHWPQLMRPGIYSMLGPIPLMQS